MVKVTIKLEGTDLSSRTAAANQYCKVVAQMANGNSVKVDLSSVLSISHSYADEIFGVFSEVYGLQTLIDYIEFHGANDHVMKSIASAIHKRVLLSGQNIPKTA